MNCRNNLSRLVLKKLSPFSSSSSSSSSQPLQQLSFDLTTCIALLQACAQQGYLRKGKQIHSYILINGFFTSPISITSLINMYSKCHQMGDAILVFDASVDYRNVYAWNAMISGFVVNRLLEDGIVFYQRMRYEGIVPDKFTFPCVIKGCLKDSEVKKTHGAVFKFGLDLDVYIGSALVNCYLKFGLMEEAKQVFEQLPVREDVVLWNAMINGYAQIGHVEVVLEVFMRMSKEGVVANKFTVTGILSVLAVMGDLYNGRSVHGFVTKMGYESGVAVLNALIDLYGKCKFIGDALSIFEMMGEKDIYSWNSIITVHEQSGDHEGTLGLFSRMLGVGVRPDLVTVTTALPACAHLAALMCGREIHGYVIINGLGKDSISKELDDVFVNNAVMDMYAKCGSMKEAQLVFDKISEKDVASWNIMIMGYGMHGYPEEALQLFYRMFEARLKPDEVTFVGVLSACSHAGFVGQGRDFFAQMKSKYCVIPTIEHYTCMIDMLGRAGQLDEAYDLAVSMPIEANSVLWRAFLAACRLHGNSDLAVVTAQRVFELEPEHCGSYVLMSNVYGAVGRYEEVLEVRHTMRQQDVRKIPGCSWIELRNGVHNFVTRDQTHPEAYHIYAVLDSLTACLCDHKYMPAVNFNDL